jgi:hypothetical protein
MSTTHGYIVKGTVVGPLQCATLSVGSEDGGAGIALETAVVGSTPNTAGLTIDGESKTDTAIFNLQPASASFPGAVTTGTQSIAGAKTFTSAAVFSSGLTPGTLSGTTVFDTGFQLPTSGGTAATNNFYEVYTHTGAVASGPFTSNQACVPVVVRNGRTINVEVPFAFGETNSGAPASVISITALPSRFAALTPGTNFAVLVLDNDSSYTNGWATITSGRVIHIVRNAAQNNFTQGAVTGGFQGFTMTYTSAT